MEFKIIAKTFQGLEELLAKEVTALGADNIEIGNRMVSFTGDQEMLYRANFCLRTAVRVLKPIKEFTATDADERVISLVDSLSVCSEHTGCKSDRQGENFKFHIVVFFNFVRQ